VELLADRVLIRISWRCAGVGCGIVRQLHVFEDATIDETTESRLRDALAIGYWRGVAHCAHPIGIVENQTISFDLIRGGIDLRGWNQKEAHES
jgi:hypothetical protein